MSIFNHCDIIGLKICRIRRKKTQNKGYYGVHGHSIYSLGHIAIFIFCRFGLKLPIHAHFGEFWGIFPLDMATHHSNPKRTILARKHVQRFDWGIRSTKGKYRTGQDSQQSRKVVIFRLSGEKPPLYRLKPEFAWRVTSPT